MSATILLPIHIIAGSIAIIAGFVSMFALKGMNLHRKSGMIFVYAMLALGGTGAMIAGLRSQPPNVIGGSIALYLVTTGLLTVRRRDRDFYWIDAWAMVAAIVIAFFSLRLGLDISRSATGTMNGVPSAPLFVFGTVALLAALGDVRMMLARGLQGSQRIARHLWRMSFALFIASGSFFLGQAKVIPKPIRILPLLAIPALLPLVLMLYWLARVLFTKWYRRRAAQIIQPMPAPRSA
jgi:uncharacterized membrane protein